MAALETYAEYLGMKSKTDQLGVFRLVDKSHLKRYILEISSTIDQLLLTIHHNCGILSRECRIVMHM